MNDIIPSYRQSTLIGWQDLYSDLSFDYKLQILIHGVGFELHVTSKELYQKLTDYFPKRWQIASKNPIHVYWRKPEEHLLAGKQWEDMVDPNCFFQDHFICQRDFMAYKIDPFQFQLMAKELVDDGLFNFLRYLLPIHLLNQNRILFHSSCVVDDNQQAYLFFGPSGAGKTTIASLCQGGVILGDDMNILSLQDGKVYVEGAALGQRFFHKGSFGTSFPVNKMFWLTQSHEFDSSKISEGKLGFILSSFANLFWNQLNQENYNKVFQFAHKLSQISNLQELKFKKSNEVWDYVRKL